MVVYFLTFFCSKISEIRLCNFKVKLWNGIIKFWFFSKNRKINGTKSKRIRKLHVYVVLHNLSNIYNNVITLLVGMSRQILISASPSSRQATVRQMGGLFLKYCWRLLNKVIRVFLGVWIINLIQRSRIRFDRNDKIGRSSFRMNPRNFEIVLLVM